MQDKILSSIGENHIIVLARQKINIRRKKLQIADVSFLNFESAELREISSSSSMHKCAG